jgi:hypothetical protein
MIDVGDLTITIATRAKRWKRPPIKRASELGRIGTAVRYVVYPEPFASRMIRLTILVQNEAQRKAAPKVSI